MNKIVCFSHIEKILDLIDFQLQIESSKKTKPKLSVKKLMLPKDDFF